VEWRRVLRDIAGYLKKLQARATHSHEHGRVKKWLSYLQRTWPQAAELHAAIRRVQDSHEILGVIEQALASGAALRAARPEYAEQFDPAEAVAG
jgi:tRNA-dihydrouridine synthase C